MAKIFTSILFFIAFSISLWGQNTVGLLSYDFDKTSDGYNLYFPHNQGNTYLLNNCGEIVHSWEDMDVKPGNSVEMTDEGNIYMLKRGDGVSTIQAGGNGEKVELRDWDNNILWEFTYLSEEYRMHHDFEILPNGNVLLIAWHAVDSITAINGGRDPLSMASNQLWPDKVIEVQVNGANSGEIVWEWNSWDHLIQDFDASKDNYGIVADHPERINVNFQTNSGNPDWMHMNCIDYNSDLDQIMLSVPTFNEIWIIDHSTTTAEAKGSTGGLSGKGGDLLFRWGNPMAYDNGTEADQKLSYQHDSHWIDLNLDSSAPDYGKIIVFNNRAGDDFSTVNIIDPDFVSNASGYSMNGNTFAPADFDWTYSHPEPEKMYSTGLSSVQRLPNGNTLIAAGRTGYICEITAEDEDIVWEYENPINGTEIASQGDVIAMSANLVFGMKRYEPDFPGFAGKDLSPKGFIELNPNTDFCSIPSVANDNELFSDIAIYPNPAKDFIRMDFDNSAVNVEWIEVFDILGNSVYKQLYRQEASVEINTSDWVNGVYMVGVNGNAFWKIMVLE